LTSERIAGLLFVGVLATVAAHCGAVGECLRYSDCGDGLTCSAGHCVASSSGSDAAMESGGDATDEGSTDAPASRDGEVVDTGVAAHDAALEAIADAASCVDGGCIQDAGTTGDAMSDAGTAKDAASD
jgi:hypothetical protein